MKSLQNSPIIIKTNKKMNKKQKIRNLQQDYESWVKWFVLQKKNNKRCMF